MPIKTQGTMVVGLVHNWTFPVHGEFSQQQFLGGGHQSYTNNSIFWLCQLSLCEEFEVSLLLAMVSEGNANSQI